jgi:hypothetical protein
VGVFVAGTCFGLLLAFEAARHRARRGFRDPDRMAAHVLNHMRRRLDLSDEQAKQILPVLQSHLRRIRESLIAEHDAMSAEVLPFLTEEQAAEHSKFVEERRRRFFRSKGEPCE